jgi:broad specificity phosphatase PhoE
MKRLYFMRHGLSVYNQIGKFSGRLDSPISDVGREDVKQNAQSLIGTKIDVIVSSPLQRALESAKIIADVIDYPKDNILISDLFSERDFGALEGTPYIPLAVKDDVEDIETVEDLIKRAQKGFEWLNELDADDILLVSHGSLGRALRYVISQELPYDHPVQFKNAEIVTLIS